MARGEDSRGKPPLTAGSESGQPSAARSSEGHSGEMLSPSRHEVPRSRLEGVSEFSAKALLRESSCGTFLVSPRAQQHDEAMGSTHPLLLVPIHLQRRPAVPARPPGHEGVLVIPEHHLLLLGRGGGGLGSNIVGPRRVQPMDGVGQQLAVADGD